MKKTVPNFSGLEPSMTRRNLMGRAMAGIGAGAMIAGCDFVSGLEAKERNSSQVKPNAKNKNDDGIIQQTVSEHARKVSLPEGSFELPRYKPQKTGNFDLNNPLDNHIAYMKVQADLAGGATMIAQYGWLLIAPPGQPAFPFLGRLTLIKAFMTPATEDLAPNIGEHDTAIWGTMTTVHVDPRTFKPVDKIYNPYIDRVIDVPDIHYADRLVFRVGQSIVVPGVDPKFYEQPWDRDGGFSQFNIDAGDEISYVVLGSAQKPGPMQPRCDVGFWTAKRTDLMDPAQTSIPIRRDYSVIQKLAEYDWYGVSKQDQAQLFVHMTGWRTDDHTKLPLPIKQHIYDRFTDRFDFT